MNRVEPIWPHGVEPVARRRPIRPVREHDERDERDRPRARREESHVDEDADGATTDEHVDVRV